MHDPVTVDPTACPDLTTGSEPLSGTLLDWRWTDQGRGQWSALVRVRTAKALQYERWVDGQHLRRG